MAEIELSALNEQASLTPHALIAHAETAYAAAMRYVRDRVLERADRLLLLAGPSGSGKTTSANLLRDLFRAAGHEARVVSLDDFYRRPDDPDYPGLPCGSPDYECVESLQIDKLHHVIECIQKGKDVYIPRFDFKEGRSIPDATLLPATRGGIVIFEGLHALNPLLTDGLPDRDVYRLFISVSTNLVHRGERLLSGKKMRFCRRLVRDSIFRSSDAARTLSLWRNVLEGEEKYLYPYRHTAHFCLNTFHAFELCVLAEAALSLLAAPEVQSDPYAAVVRDALSRVTPVSPSLVPPTSLIREFMAGGIYEALY